MGRVEDKNTVSDFDSEEQKRGISISTSLSTIPYKNKTLYILDTPGFADFVGEQRCAMRVADGALVLRDATAGVEVQTQSVWDFAETFETPAIFFVSKLDRENTDFDNVVADIQENISDRAVPLYLPIGSQLNFKGVVNVLTGKSYMYNGDGSKDYTEGEVPADMADAVAACIQEIGGQADVIMVSTHAGLGAEYSADGSDAAQTILDKCPEVDVLQLGHTHTTYINSAPIPVGEAKNNAGEVVRYDLTLNADKEITSATVETVSMEGIEPDQGLRELPAVKSAQEKTVSFIQDNVLGHASADFQPVDEIKGIPSGRIEDTAVIDLIGTVQLENSGADVTAVALFKDTSDLKKGDLNYGNLFDIYKYPNVLYTVKVSGAEMKAYMEWAAACWNQWKEGDVSISFNPQKPGYLHDHFIGLNYEVNLSKPAGERIENVTFQGKPLTDDMTLTLCVNDYRYTGLKNEGIISGEKEWESSASVRDMLVAYLAEHDPLEPAVDHNWKITGVDLQKDNPDRATLIELVNTGRLESPYSPESQPGHLLRGAWHGGQCKGQRSGQDRYRRLLCGRRRSPLLPYAGSGIHL